MTEITFQVHKLTGSAGMRGENVGPSLYSWSDLAVARRNLLDLAALFPESEFKLVVLGAKHIPFTNEDGSGRYVGLALCQSTDGTLTEGDAVKDGEAVTCPLCLEVIRARTAAKLAEVPVGATQETRDAILGGARIEIVSATGLSIEEDEAILDEGDFDELLIEVTAETNGFAPKSARSAVDEENILGDDYDPNDTLGRVALGDHALPIFGIQSIETGVVFARQSAPTASLAEKLFQDDNPEYARPGLIRAVPGFPHDAPLGRSPLIEREPTLKETAAAMARAAETKVEREIAHLERAFDLADRDLTAAKETNDATLIALRTSIVDSTGKALADRRRLLTEYKAVR